MNKSGSAAERGQLCAFVESMPIYCHDRIGKRESFKGVTIPEGRNPDSLQLGIEAYRTKRRAGIKGRIADLGNIIAQLNTFKGRTVAEAVGRDPGNTRSYDDRFKGRTALECSCLKLGDRIGNCNRGERSIFVESAHSYGLKSICESKGLDTGTLGKGVVIYQGNRLRNGKRGQRSTSAEGISADGDKRGRERQSFKFDAISE